MNKNDGRLKKYSQAEVAKILEETNDEEKVTLFCGKHFYTALLASPPGISKGNSKCPECWQAYYTKLIAAMPAPTRQQFLESLHEFSYDVVKNPGEFKPFLHPEVTIIKDDPSL